MKTNRRESQVLAGVLAYLELRPDVFVWRQNTSAGFLPSGVFSRSNKRGVSDIVGLQAVVNPLIQWPFVGRFIGVEAKREKGGAQSPDQVLFQKNIEAFGGLYVLARGIEDVEKALGPVTVHIPKHMKKRLVPR